MRSLTEWPRFTGLDQYLTEKEIPDRAIEKCKNRIPILPEEPFFRNDGASLSVVTVHMPVLVPWNPAPDFAEDWDGVRIVAWELNLDKEAIENVGTIPHGETTSAKDGVAFSHNADVGIFRRDIFCHCGEQPGFQLVPRHPHALSHQGLLGELTEAAARCTLSAVFVALTLLRLPNTACHPDPSII